MPTLTFEWSDGREKTVAATNDWTLMEIARREDIDGVAAECGGGGICGTCHLVLSQPAYDQLPAPDATEQAMLELVPERTATSRLSCQVIVSDALEGCRVRVPSEQLEM